MHGGSPEMIPNRPDFRPFHAVTILHSGSGGSRVRAGFGTVEVIVAVAVFGAGILGVAALGSGAWRMAQVASLRSDQALAAASVLEWGRLPAADLDVEADTVVVSPGLVEVRVTVRSRAGPGGPETWIARRHR